MAMNRKTRTQLLILRTKLQKLHRQLAGAPQQCDDPDDVARIKLEIAATDASLEQMKSQTS